MDLNIGKRVLFIGTGGGNDVFSTLLAALELRSRASWHYAAIAGVLSPFHRHGVMPIAEPSVGLGMGGLTPAQKLNQAASARAVFVHIW